MIGVGGVGEAIAVIGRGQPWLEKLVLADYRLERAKEVQDRLGDPDRFPIERVDAREQAQIESLIQKHQPDLVMNACDPVYVEPIFEAAYGCGRSYIDLAMSLSKPHQTQPYQQTGVKLGDFQFERSKAWEGKGLLALVGMGVEPGMSDVFARYAKETLFDEIEEIGVRDGANLTVAGYEFAPNFSIWSTIEECLNPPVIWEKEKGWYTTEPFSEPEIFEFPEGIGRVECVNVEHEEVLLIPRWVDCRRVTFKYGLGEQFISVLKTLKMLGLDSKEPVRVKDVWVAPRDVVAACLPDPAYLGEKMSGKTCAGVWVKGWKAGRPRQVYLYQVAENETCMRTLGVQAVVAQTAVNAVIAWDLLNHKEWQGYGVLGPEAFSPLPFMKKLGEYGFPYGVREM
jgi:saccharopine dehydrogenase-like NADP-dependent oxidoreductase